MTRAISLEAKRWPSRRLDNSSKQSNLPIFRKSPSHRIRDLQKAVGNHIVQRLSESGRIQPKLKINQPEDIYEREANDVAEQIMGSPKSDIPVRHSRPAIQLEEKPLPQLEATVERSGLPEIGHHWGTDDHGWLINQGFYEIGGYSGFISEQDINPESREEYQMMYLVSRYEHSDGRKAEISTEYWPNRVEESVSIYSSWAALNEPLFRKKTSIPEALYVPPYNRRKTRRTKRVKAQDGSFIQRQPQDGEETLRAKQVLGKGTEASSSFEEQVYSARRNGRPLSRSERAFFEPRFGRDFGEVRVHTDAKAAESAMALNARAYTFGRDIVFGKGEYAPGTRSGLKLFAHELTHVLQQTGESQLHSLESQIQRHELLIPTAEGQPIRIPGISTGQTSFPTIGSQTSLLKPGSQGSSGPITGGFKHPLSLNVGFATGAITGKADSLIAKAAAQIDPDLVDAVKSIASDLYILRVLRSFLLEDKGKLAASVSSGHYDGKRPPTIDVGTDEGPLRTRLILVHELMHYAFDKTDSAIRGTEKEGSHTEHAVMQAFETRYALIELIRSGSPPLPTKEMLSSGYGPIFALFFGAPLKGGDLLPAMQKAIEANDVKLLSEIVGRSYFVSAIVESGLYMTRGQQEKESDLEPEQWAELAFVWTQNAMLVRRAMNKAVSISQKTGRPLKHVFGTDEWKSSMSQFIHTFATTLQHDPRQDVAGLEKSISL